MKKTFLVLTCQALSLISFGQVIFSSSFGNLALQDYTTTSANTQYTTVPANFTLFNDGLNNNIGSAANPNKPFNVPALKTTGWAAVYNAAENDTFLVSTSWLDTTTVAVDRWIITPAVTIPSGNVVLTWLAKSPDASFPDGYEVYGTSNLNVAIPTDFTVGDLLFSVADGNTAGQGEKSTWTRHSINLSSFAGQTLRFAFRNNSKDMYQLWIDDIEIKALPVSLDAGVTSIVADKYVLVNSSNVIKTNVTNSGAADLFAVGLKYMINNSSVNSELFSLATPLSFGQTTAIPFALPYTLSSPGLYTIKSWVSSVNNTSDQNQLNDTAVYYVTIQASAPARTVLIEQFVSANNGESPDAQSRTTVLQSAPAIVVNIHDQDSLTEPGAAALIADYKTDFGTALIDRNYFSDNGKTTVTRPDYGNRLGTEIYKLSPAAISIVNKTYNAATRQLSFTLKADFIGEVKGDYRLNAYLTENNVYGPYGDTTVNGYNQLNDYYNVVWSPFYHVGYYSPAVDSYVMNSLMYKHNNTLVHTFDGSYGSAGLIPFTGGTQGQSYQKTYTLTLPAAAANVQKYVADNIYIVGFVAEYSADKNKRTVLNTIQEKLNTNNEALGIPEIASQLQISVYPNPSNSGLFYLNTKENNAYDLKVFDLFGKCLKAENGAKAGTLDLSGLADGIYLLNLRSGKQIVNEKIVIQKN